MKIRIDAKEFERLVSVASQALSSKPMKPEHECVYVEVNSQDGTPIMKVQGNDVGLKICKVTDRLDAYEDGNALIPAKTLNAFLKLMNGDVDVAVDETNKCTLKCGGKKCTISCLGTEDYDPDFQSRPDERLVKMDGDAFAKIVNSTAHCISTDEGRLILTGVNFAFDGENGICEGKGLDGFRLASVQCKAETNETFDETIPANYAKLIAKNIVGGKNVSFRFGSRSVIVEDYDTMIEASLLSGQYMDTKRLIFRNGKMHVKVNTEELLQSVRMAMIAVGVSKNVIVLKVQGGHDVLTVTAQSDQSGSVSNVPCETSGAMDGGGITEIAFNGKYLEDALKAAMEYAGEVTLVLNTAASPMALMPLQREDYYQLVLPVRRMS